ncbi:MAG: rod shape-determining protein MreD [Clostridiales bacterium]|nr:rod shape-determining protein MreD [Clostridiales bacterium]
MRVGVISLIILLNIVIETTIMPFLSINGVIPDFMLSFIVSFGLLGGNPIAPIIGFCAGLVYDMTMGAVIGIYALGYMIIGFIIGAIEDSIYVDSFIVPMALAMVAAVFKELIILIYTYIYGMDVSFFNLLLWRIIPHAILTAIATPLILFIMGRLYRYKFMTKRWKFRDS